MPFEEPEQPQCILCGLELYRCDCQDCQCPYPDNATGESCDFCGGTVSTQIQSTKDKT